MIGAVFKVTLFMHLLHLIVQVAGQSPCPSNFHYTRDEITGEVIGEIEIQSAPIGSALHISVALSIAVALPSKYVGRLELAESKEQSVKAVQQGRPLKYKIHFPLRRPIPVLTGLWFNNQQICSGPRATGPIVTSIVLNHTLYPPGVLPLSEGQGNSIPSRPQLEPVPTATSPPQQLPPLPPPVQPPVYQPVSPPTNLVPTEKPVSPTFNVDNVFFDVDQNKQPECGRSSSTNKINLLIARGVKTTPGQWPWVVAIFIVKFEFEFQCAGSLITNTHVLTAAHCFHLDNVNIPAGALLVSLGRYRLRDWREKGSVNREIADYTIHPDYNAGGNADSDLAVMTLRERVEYSPVIKPICLWSGPSQLQSVVGKMGYVVGWGRDELGNPYVQEPRMAKVPIVSQENCLWSNTNFVTFTSNRTFCAGHRNGSGPCNGDSGSGLVIYDTNSGRYQLRGIVSRSLLDASMSCDLTQYVVYVDVAKHMDWIRTQTTT